MSCWRAKRHGCAIPTPNYIGSPPHPNEAADEYMYVVRTTLAPPPPALLAAPFRCPYFCKKATPRLQRTTCRVGANANGMHSQRGRAVLLDVVKKYLQPISTRRPIYPRSLLLSPPGAFSPTGCSQVHPPQRKQGYPSHRRSSGRLPRV